MWLIESSHSTLTKNEVLKKEVEIRIGYNKGYNCVGDAFKC